MLARVSLEVAVRPEEMDPEELMVTLSDVLDAVSAGRLDDHGCPVCQQATLVCTEKDGEVRVRCPNCRLNFVGLLAN